MKKFIPQLAVVCIGISLMVNSAVSAEVDTAELKIPREDAVSEIKNENGKNNKANKKEKPAEIEKEKKEKDASVEEKLPGDRVEKEKLEKIEREKGEREQLEKERLEKERLERERLEKEKSVKKKENKEYIALIFGYGGAFPVAAYGSRYRPAHQFSGTVGIYCLNLYGLSPEIHVRYSKLESKSDPMRFGSSLAMLDIFPAIVYRYNISLPRNTLTVYGRIFDGVSRVGYATTSPFFPYARENIIEYINIFGFSAGCYYDVWKGLLIGVDVGYSLIFTAGKPLQSVSVGMNVGWRIF